MLSAFARLGREGNLQPTDLEKAVQAFRYDLDTQYRVVELDATLFDTAGQLVQRYPLRAFVSADRRLLTIAQSEGVETIDPSAI